MRRFLWLMLVFACSDWRLGRLDETDPGGDSGDSDVPWPCLTDMDAEDLPGHYVVPLDTPWPAFGMDWGRDSAPAAPGSGAVWVNNLELGLSGDGLHHVSASAWRIAPPQPLGPPSPAFPDEVYSAFLGPSAVRTSRGGDGVWLFENAGSDRPGMLSWSYHFFTGPPEVGAVLADADARIDNYVDADGARTVDFWVGALDLDSDGSDEAVVARPDQLLAWRDPYPAVWQAAPDEGDLVLVRPPRVSEANAADVNGDGHVDLLLRGRLGEALGEEVWVVHGPFHDGSDLTEPDVRILATPGTRDIGVRGKKDFQQGYGYGLFGSDDLTGDGLPDLVVEGGRDDGVVRGDEVWVGSGLAPGTYEIEDLVDAHLFYEEEGPWAQAFAAGDVNGDGVADLALAAGPFKAEGDHRVVVHLGPLSGERAVERDADRVLHYSVNTRIGYQTPFPAGDLDMDGYDDFVLGFNPERGTGRLALWPGCTP